MRTPAPSKSPNRRRVLAYVEQNPGCCQQEVADALNLTRNAIAHHLRSLERLQTVSQVRQGRRLLLFPSAVKAPAQRFALGLLRRSTANAILRELVAEPNLPWRALARRLDMSPHTIRWHVQRLQDEGFIVVLSRLTERGHIVHVHPAVRTQADRLAASPEALAAPEGDALAEPVGAERLSLPDLRL